MKDLAAEYSIIHKYNNNYKDIEVGLLFVTCKERYTNFEFLIFGIRFTYDLIYWFCYMYLLFF